ncbi:hypothetical protein ACIPMZ_03615 [Scandinavium goeteborgense]|uniref:hypothetical protein n=1 Tax=Scandinavium goeteborgense TaxID=1851514 RepID=UPI0038162BE4
MNLSEYKRSLLYRKAQGNLCRGKYFNKIKDLINEDVNIDHFLGLEETDSVINSLKNKEMLSSHKDLFHSYPDFILFIKEKVVGQSYYLLIDEEWKFCGAYKINHDIEYNKHYDFNESASDEIRIISCDFHFQIQIDYDDRDIYCSYIQYK